MKNKETETKFKPALGIGHHLFGWVACLGALVLLCSPAPAQNLFMSSNDGQNGSIFKFTPDGVRSTLAIGLDVVTGLAFDGAGNLFVADYSVSTGSGSILK